MSKRVQFRMSVDTTDSDLMAAAPQVGVPLLTTG
jgi:hypothetical protein